MHAPRASALLALCLLGCASGAPQQQEQMARIEAERRVDEALRDAHKYVAVVRFAFNSDAIDAAGAHELDWFLDKIRDYPPGPIDVKGHADATGGEAHNVELSQRRAERVADYLVSHGIARSRITTFGLGEQFPARSNETASGRGQNRRAEVRMRLPGAPTLEPL